MWVGTESMSTLVERSSWKVEFFSDDKGTALESEYPLEKIGAVTKVRKEFLTPNEYPERTFNYLSLGHVEELTGDLVDFTPTEGSEVKSRCRVFREEDVLYCKLRPYLNKAYVANPPVEEGICSTEFIVLSPLRDKILPQFLRAMLVSPFVHDHVENLQTGSTRPRLRQGDLLDLEVPVPPFEKQKSFEKFIAERTTHRRNLREKVEALPDETMEGVLGAIRNGETPD